MSSDRSWYTGGIPPMDGLHRYTEMIWGPDDPERAPRPKGGQKDKAPHRTLSKTKASDWMPAIRKLLADGKPRTLNAIGVILIDKTASITSGSPFAQALWQLVQQGELAFGEPAPILFVLASKVKAKVLYKKGRYILDSERDDEEEGSEPEPAPPKTPPKASKSPKAPPKAPKPPKPPKAPKAPRPRGRELAPWEAARIIVTGGGRS
jgi:hypothetical protein